MPVKENTKTKRHKTKEENSVNLKWNYRGFSPSVLKRIKSALTFQRSETKAA